MKKTIYLHIGFPKTGTSSIQTLLWSQRDFFEKNDYYYPLTGLLNQAGHVQLAIALKNNNEAMARQLTEELNNVQTSNIVISSEYFFSFEREHIAALKALLDGYDVTIIAYLRRQDHRIESGYLQVIKDSDMRFSGTIERYLNYIEKLPRRINYQLFLEPWAEYFGKENMKVRVFEKQQLPKGLIESFLDAIDFSNDRSQLKEAPRVNETFPMMFISLLKFTNRIRIPRVMHVFLVRVLSRLVTYLPKTKHQKKKNLLSTEKKLALLEKYNESNSVVAKEYLGRDDGVLFKEPIPKKDH